MGSTLVMTEFKRSPSKVWWANESAEWREVSASPGSQDSGFSDTETSPHNAKQEHQETPKKPSPAQRIPKDIFKETSTAQRIPKDIFKELSSENTRQNLTANFREKSTPEKSNLAQRLVKSEVKLSPKRERQRDLRELANSEPIRRNRYTKNSPKVSRGLFKLEECDAHQYSDAVQSSVDNNSLEATLADSYSWRSTQQTASVESLSTRSLPALAPRRAPRGANRTAPGALQRHRVQEAASLDCSLSSDCESELEGLFDGALESPQHTSTPKGGVRQREEGGLMKLRLKYRHERVPPIPTPFDVFSDLPDKAAASLWARETRQSFEPECMTTLQGKSIAGELNQKVSQRASQVTGVLRGVLTLSRCIETEYRNLNNGEFKHINPLVQSLTGNIVDFLRTHAPQTSPETLQLCEDIRTAKSEDSLHLINQLFLHWQKIRQELLNNQARNLVEKLEYPTSELDLRACVTGIISLSLRNEELIEIFTQADVIPILLILCEKCEGSSLKGLILRALATMCCNSSAVRQFEKYSGVQIVADTLEEQSRPEPERSEAVALLAQVTAPWLEDNHSVKGLQDYSRKLVRSLTKFVASTQCCQNLLLCAAALANLSTMDGKAIKFMVHSNTTRVLLDAVKARGPRASIYLLEQVATLIANMSASEVARKQLTEVEAPIVLLHFLKMNNSGEDVERRLQQKSIIALSRLCGDRTAATQIVELGGVEKLVKMCREKTQRFDSDAVLVAALATLRKIIDTCGSDVISALDAQELVEPKLLDSFLAYSTQNESYV
ncbi:unnamed protein product [Phaedon cochleariae]|uniref:Protein inscuteable homologue C-terminal domain-containing protein n=1 Tax=Phaedon cochleariae TaxID=80249 RepID=A0A9N9SBI3_PHACE|nr:unnamed protein product [Phaedon cochleariae]